MTLKIDEGLAVFFFVAVGLTVCAQSSGDIVSTQYAAQQAAETFGRLTGFAAEGLKTTTRLAYRPDAEAALDASEIELVPSDYLVVLTGELVRRAQRVYYVCDEKLPEGVLATVNEVAQEYYEEHDESISARDLEAVAELAEGTLRCIKSAYWVYEEGIVGRARVELETGAPFKFTSYSRALARISMLSIQEPEARDIVQAAGVSIQDEPVLVEIQPLVFVWRFQGAGHAHYVDALTGDYLTEDEMAAAIVALLEGAVAMDEEAGCADYRHHTLAPVFIEQGMHQWQGSYGLPNLCGPTSLAMVLDYWGEEIDYADVADVATEPPKGAFWSDVQRAAMFSHHSMARWDHRDDDPAGPGYAERMGEAARYGYTACLGYFDAHPWEALKEMIDEHCPFVVNITDPGHYIVIEGYASDDSDDYVWYADPSDQDFQWIWVQMWEWDDFNDDHWSPDPKFNMAIAVRPMPVDLEFLPDQPQSGQFTIRVTVRTCHAFPAAEGGSWSRVNRQVQLKGNAAGTSENIPITITYPQNVTKVSGADTQYWNPAAPADSVQVSWVFTANGNEKGGEFKVVATGWAAGYTSYRYGDGGDAFLANSITGTATTLTLNDATDALAADITDEATSLTLDDVSDFPPEASTAAWFLIQIEDELIKVTAVNGDTFTVVRGRFGTDKAAHDEDDPVVLEHDLPSKEDDPAYFHIKVDAEIMKVTAVNGNSLTVARGQHGTTAAAHGADARVLHYVADELFGWGVLRIDEHLFRIRDSSGDTVAAIGDQGNLYLAGTLTEWEDPDDVEPDDGQSELIIKNGILDEVVVVFDDDGNALIEGGYHEFMDDVNDTCDSVGGNDEEQEYLDAPLDDATHNALAVRSGGHVVAWIDAGPASVPGGGSEEPREHGGHLRLKGRVFENWTAWDYWD